jgi:hypothetical protein
MEKPAAGGIGFYLLLLNKISPRRLTKFKGGKMQNGWLKLTTSLMFAALLILAGLKAEAQYRSTISGTVMDPTGAIVPRATVTITNTATNTANTSVTNEAGIYSFPELTAGVYSLKVTAAGFETYVQSGIEVALDTSSRVDVKLVIGNVTTNVSVVENASPLDYDNVTISADIPPEVENQLPAEVSSKPRVAGSFAAFLPGVNSTRGISGFSNMSINGGMQNGQEATLDGVSMQEGDLSQGGVVAMGDYGLSPDILTEIKVDTSNYGMQFGNIAGGVIEMTTRSGTDQLHGDLYEYLKNRDLNSRAFDSIRSPDNEHEYGGGVGGPIKPHWGFTPRIRAFYFFNFGQYRQKGGANPPVLTIPTLQELGEAAPGSGSLKATAPYGTYNFDFSDYVNSSGAIIPIYDPNTTVVSGSTVTRQQFIGCDGLHPNVICATYPGLSKRAAVWNSFLPSIRTSAATTNNYLLPSALPDAILEGAWQYMYRFDMYIDQSDHIAVSVWHQGAPRKYNTELPIQLSNQQLFGDPESSWLNHLNWEHTFSVNLINHFAFGYQDRHEGEGVLNYSYVNVLPQIPGVANNTQAPPGITFSGGPGGQPYGSTDGYPEAHINSRPEYIPNDLLTWVRGKHQFTFGAEYRAVTGSQTSATSEAGTFGFSTAQTGLATGTNGNPQASFLLGQVATTDSEFYSAHESRKRQFVEAVFGGDTWRVTPKLTVNYGLRWDHDGPLKDKAGIQAWTDLSRLNEEAGGEKGAIVFGSPVAGNAYAGTSAPEKPFMLAYAPRFGFVLAPRPNLTVAAGYGISWDQLYIGSEGSQTGWDNTPTYTGTGVSSLGEAMNLDGTFPGDTLAGVPITLPDFDIGIGNGGVVNAAWRDPVHGARRPYSQQWNLRIARQVGSNASVSVAYVGSKATHVRSDVNPQNVLNPALLTLGSDLAAVFAPGSNSLTLSNGHTYQAPYNGWSSQMLGCSPTVAQSLLPYPQFCITLVEPLESSGFESYNSLQVTGEKRLQHGLYVMANFTWAKLIGMGAQEGGGLEASVYSPFQHYRYHELSSIDDPETFNAEVIYTLPFGRGQRFLHSSKLLDEFIGGWNITDATHMNGGQPLAFSATCTRPSQFVASGCYATKLPGQDILAMSKKQVDQAIYNHTAYSVFNKSAFDSSTNFTYNYVLTSGQQFTGARGFGYVNYDISLGKSFPISEKVKFKLQGQFFNAFNQHTLGTSFGTSLTASTFGQYTGTTSNPRQGQIVGRIEF